MARHGSRAVRGSDPMGDVRAIPMTPAQCRAARLLAGITQAELAAVAVIPATLISDYETGVGMPNTHGLAEIQQVLEWAGIEFIEGGVRVRKGKSDESARRAVPLRSSIRPFCQAHLAIIRGFLCPTMSG
jgi:transcriptional regulator with XRE-family HTH domain